MVKGDIKDIIVKFIFTVLGIISGFAFYAVFDHYPDFRGLLFAIFVLMALVAILVTENVRYRIKFDNSIKEITKQIKTIENGNFKIENNDKSRIEINKLFEAIEGIRKNLKGRLIIKSAALDIINTLATNIELESLIDVVMVRLVEEMGSNWGVFYLYNKQTGKMELKKSLGLSKNIYKEFDVTVGEGIIGLTAQTLEVKIFRDIPADTKFENKTFLGRIIPKNVMTVPITNGEELKAVIAFGSIYDFTEEQLKLIDLLRNYIGFSVSNCVAYEKTQRLTKELQFQNQLIQNMNDELEKKVNERTDFLNSIINSIDEYAIISIDKKGYITTWNKGAELIRGYKAEEVIGRHISYVYENDLEEKKYLAEHFEMAAKEGRFIEKRWQIRKDGTKYFADIVVTPIFSAAGELTGFTNITKDITSIRNLEQMLYDEKAYNDKLIKNSNTAVLFIDLNGVITNSNTLAQKLLTPLGTELEGKQFCEFFVEKERMDKNIKNVCMSSGMGEFINELYYKQDGIEKLKIKALSVSRGEEGSGVLVYLLKE